MTKTETGIKPTKPSACIIADSITEAGHRLTTMQVTMHRFVLAEFNTHRAFSRNSASSRAIPIEKRIRAVLEDPAIPLEWGSNRAGMQAGEQLEPGVAQDCREEWLRARYRAVEAARSLAALGLHKQVANRLLEPFLWHTAIVSATEWENFFAQRCSPLAQPEIRAVAEAMDEALRTSLPRPVLGAGWHLPYVQRDEWLDAGQAKAISVARCARVSYLTHEGLRDPDKDLELYRRLLSADPSHASPFEHVARPARPGEAVAGNFQGWVQLRHELGLGWSRRKKGGAAE